MTTPLRAAPTRPTLIADHLSIPLADPLAGPGFVLRVGVAESFGHGPQAIRDLVEAAETLQELARDLLPRSETFTTLSVTPPTAD